MYIVFILLKAPVTAKALNDNLRTSGMSRRDSVFSPATLHSIVFLLFVPPPSCYFLAHPESEMC